MEKAMRLKTYSRSAEIARAGALAVAFIGVGTLAFAFAPGTQVAAPARQAVVVAKPTMVAMTPAIAVRKAVEEPPAVQQVSVLAPQLLTNASIGLASPLRSTGELQPAALVAATPVPGKAATVTTKSTVAIGPEEAEKLYRRAEGLVADGDFAGARLLLERAIEAGHAGAIFMLASTYDPNVLSKVNALGIKGEPEKAKALYQQALAAGIDDSNGRLSALTATN
jgi:tetratricopeptide (TPR) repeat protein